MDIQIVSILNKIQKDLKIVKKRLEDLSPIYGSSVWWDWSDKLALKDYKTGKSKTLSSKKDLQKFLNFLKK